MVSYFDLPPQQKVSAANIEAVAEEERRQLGKMSLLSPAVTQLLDDLGQEQSDSDSEEGNLSEDEDTKDLAELTKKDDPRKLRQDKQLNTENPRKSSLSSSKGDRSPHKSAQAKLPPARTGGAGSSKPKQPHMARFHSLRSMLFSSTIEDKMRSMNKEDCGKEQEAANKWTSQHNQRQIHNRPKTPEKDAQGKDGLGSRIKMKIRRMTSKKVPTMETLNEDGGAHDFSDHGSTASSDNEEEPYRWKPREADEESIDHSDVEDLIRWVSRRDPPSDGEAREKAPVVSGIQNDSDHESLRHSDVDDLVQFVSRKSSGPETKQDHHTGYSDASTESDSEMIKEHDSSEEEDVDDLVRWISHRDGPIAGPVRRKQHDEANSPKTESHVSYHSDAPDFGRWIERYDGTSGESGATTPTHDLLEEPERGRPRSRDGPPRQQQKGHLTHDDVDELVKWVSRKDSKQSASPKHDQEVERLQKHEEQKKQQLGMTVDEGSLSHSDVKGLIEHVRTNDLSLQGSEPAVTTSRPGEAETGDLRQLRPGGPERTELTVKEHVKDATMGERLQERSERGSLGEQDVDELVRWISQKH